LLSSIVKPDFRLLGDGIAATAITKEAMIIQRGVILEIPQGRKTATRGEQGTGSNLLLQCNKTHH
jgi:hypothetical protein